MRRSRRLLPRPVRSAIRRLTSSTVSKAAPAATPRTIQSLTRKRRTRPGAARARTASGVSLSTSSTMGATTSEAAVSDGVTPAALQTHRLTVAINSANGIPVANTPEVSAQETVLARARANQHTTSHRHPIHAPSAVRIVGETTTATRSTSSANQEATARTRRSTRKMRDLDVRSRSRSHHSCSGDGAFVPGPAVGPGPGPAVAVVVGAVVRIGAVAGRGCWVGRGSEVPLETGMRP